MKIKALIIHVLLMIPILWIISTGGQTSESETFDNRSTLTPSEQLEKEHRLIMVVIEATKKETAKINESEELDTRRIRQILDFYTQFVETGHYAKEERVYYPTIIYNDSRTITILVDEFRNQHQYGRSILEQIRYALDYDKASPDFTAERLEQYTEMLEDHIAREERLLFPKADVNISGTEERAILMGFEKIDKEELGTGFHEKYRKIAEELISEK